MSNDKQKTTIYKVFIILFSMAFLIIAIFIIFSKKTTYSNYEKRPTKNFPILSAKNFISSDFFRSIDEYLIDSIPFRDIILDKINYFLGLKGLKKIIVFNSPSIENFENKIDNNDTLATNSIIINEYPSYIEYENPTINMIKSGAIIVSDGYTIRGMFGPGPWEDSNKAYADIINKYIYTFPNIDIYTMIVPIAVTFYAPENQKEYQFNNIDSIMKISQCFDTRIKQIDVYNALLPHIKEDIYLRTDHHWSQLGAYYAAKEFAKIAKVDFAPLDKYDIHKVENYCGTLYQKTGMTELRDIGETFTYYTPNDISYASERCNFRVDENQEAILRTDFKNKDFFNLDFRDTHSAYMIFMSGDVNITHINTETKNSRNLLVLKDSFGNAVVPNLFYSFENIWVVDYRYFVDDFKEFVNEKNITDILFVNNITACRKNDGALRYENLLNKKKATSSYIDN